MSSREKILSAIRQNKPGETPLPETFVVENAPTNLSEKYLEILHSIGGKGIVVNDLKEVESYLQEQLQNGVEVVSCCGNLSEYNAPLYLRKTGLETETIHTLFLNGKFAVAENGAVWVTEKEMISRILPFICQELVIIIEEKNIVANMHEAYARIRVDEEGFGTFIAGPSKTADIEQSLVIGAHGPLGLRVYLTPTLSNNL